MICFDKNEKSAERLLDYAAGTLAPEDLHEIETHAAACPSCQTLLQAQREAWNALDTFSAPSVSHGFDQRLYARIAREQARSPFSRWWKRWFVDASAWKPALAGAAACAVVAIGLTVNVRPTVVEDSSTKQARIESGDIEQVEQILEDLELLMPEASSDRM
jgi:anti-sigma factor RsiW